MYNNFRSMCLSRPLSISEYYRFIPKCSINSLLNESICNSNKFVNRRFQSTGTKLQSTLKLRSSHVHAFLKKREKPSATVFLKSDYNSAYDKLLKISSQLYVSLESICFDLNYNKLSNNFILPLRCYPIFSKSLDGHIDYSMTNSQLYLDQVKDTIFNDQENQYLNRKLTPAGHPLYAKMYDNYFKERNFNNGQRIFDVSVKQLIESLDANKCPSLVVTLFLLKVSVSYKHLCLILDKCVDELSGLSLKELVKLAISVRGYLDDDYSYLKHYLVRIGMCMENKVKDLDNYTQDNLIDSLLPLSLMQFSDHPITWSVVSNYNVLNKMTDGYEGLDLDHQGKLLTILSSLESYPDVSNKYYKVYESLVHSLTENMDSVDHKVILNMMKMPVLFHSFEMFRDKLYSQTRTRWNKFPSNALASVYLNHKDNIPKEHADYIINNLANHVNIILPKYIPELYCSYLNDGDIRRNGFNDFQNNLLKAVESLTASNISNILMYLSINGKAKIEIYPDLIERFNELKKKKEITNQEILDVVLSMSLVGIHNNDVWAHVDMNNIVLQLPTNILVYLGYSFLITDMKDGNLWKVLLHRILNGDRTSNAETYEVLRAAQILEFVPKYYIINNNKLNDILKSCRHTFQNRQSKQKFRTSVPYEVMFKNIGVRYMKDYVVDDLYEATYYFPEQKLIVLPISQNILHPTSGLLAGDLLLRTKVWNKSDYTCFLFPDSKWNEFYNPENPENTFWDIDGLSKTFCKMTKINSLFREKVPDNKKYLKFKGPREIKGILKSRKFTGDHFVRIKMFQNMIKNNQLN